jgi:DNA-binding phage protein
MLAKRQLSERIADLSDFDMAQQLKNEEDIAAYITI